MKRVPLLAATAATIGLAAAAVQASAANSQDTGAPYRQIAVINIPVAQPPLFGDLIFADNQSGLVFFSDLTNSSLDVVNGHTDRLVGRINGFVNGPGGVLVDNQGQVWAGDGNGVVQVSQAHAPFHKLASVSVGADTDELGYDPRDHIIAVTSPNAGTADNPQPFVSLIDATPVNQTYRVLAHIQIPGVPQDSLEQPQWDAAIGQFVESIRVAKEAPNGELALIDPVTMKLTRVIRFQDRCVPGGLAVGLGDEVLAGCNVGGPELVDVSTGRELMRYSDREQCCADQVWFDSEDSRYFVAEAGAAGPPPNPQLKMPAVSVIDAKTHAVDSVIRLGNSAIGFHQVTALGREGKVFVPEPDGIHVFLPR